MFYRFALTVPAGTAQTDPLVVPLPLTNGVITKVSISFPAGCAGLAGIRLKRYEHVIWPSNPDSWFAYDDLTVEWDEEFPVLDDPPELIAEAYNEDDTYDHTIYVRFALRIPRTDWEYEQARLLAQLLEEIRRGRRRRPRVVEREPGLYEIG